MSLVDLIVTVAYHRQDKQDTTMRWSLLSMKKTQLSKALKTVKSMRNAELDKAGFNPLQPIPEKGLDPTQIAAQRAAERAIEEKYEGQLQVLGLRLSKIDTLMDEESAFIKSATSALEPMEQRLSKYMGDLFKSPGGSA